MTLRAAREQSGKTQAQVAKEAKISEAQYQNIEYGKNTPSVTTAIRIAGALGSTVEALFGAATPAIGETPGGNRANQEDLQGYNTTANTSLSRGTQEEPRGAGG